MRNSTLLKVGEDIAEERAEYSVFDRYLNQTSAVSRQAWPELSIVFGENAMDVARIIFRDLDARDVIQRVVLDDAEAFPASAVSARLRRHADVTGGGMVDFNVAALFPSLDTVEKIEVCDHLEERGFVMDGEQVLGFNPR